MTEYGHWLIQALVWSGLTIFVYQACLIPHRRWHYWYTTPLLTTSIILICILLALGVSYRDYSRGAYPLVWLLTPATVAFAAPIYEQRAVIRKHWRVLAVGIVAGSLTSMLSSWALACALDVDRTLWINMLPRNITMPFAMPIADTIGGKAELASVFVAFSGTLGVTLGGILLDRLPLKSKLAYGAAFGMCAHAAGTARSHLRGREEGAAAGITMIFVGLMNVLAAPLIGAMLSKYG